jgi:hypothetical protein
MVKVMRIGQVQKNEGLTGDLAENSMRPYYSKRRTDAFWGCGCRVHGLTALFALDGYGDQTVRDLKIIIVAHMRIILLLLASQQ